MSPMYFSFPRNETHTQMEDGTVYVSEIHWLIHIIIRRTVENEYNIRLSANVLIMRYIYNMYSIMFGVKYKVVEWLRWYWMQFVTNSEGRIFENIFYRS